MALALFVMFIVIPVIELVVIVQVAQSIGVLITVAALLLVSLCGAWLVKREGLGVLRRTREQLSRGQLPTDELIDGAIIVIAGALLLFPGFVSDTVGLLMLIPPVRSLVRKVVSDRFRARMGVFTGTYARTRVYDVSDVRDAADSPSADARWAGDDRSGGPAGELEGP